MYEKHIQKDLTFISTKYQSLVLTLEVVFRKLLPEKHTIFNLYNIFIKNNEDMT